MVLDVHNPSSQSCGLFWIVIVPANTRCCVVWNPLLLLQFEKTHAPVIHTTTLGYVVDHFCNILATDKKG